jgi:hypothetical protein
METPITTSASALATALGTAAPAPGVVAAALERSNTGATVIRNRAETPVVSLESIETRLNCLRAEQTLVEKELARRKTEDGKVKATARHGFIANLPAALDVADLVSVIHLLADEAGVQARVYRIRGAAKVAKSPRTTKAPTGKPTIHGRGFRLSEHTKEQIMAAIRKPGRNLSEIKRRFGVASQTVYLYKARVDAEKGGKAKAMAAGK